MSEVYAVSMRRESNELPRELFAVTHRGGTKSGGSESRDVYPELLGLPDDSAGA